MSATPTTRERQPIAAEAFLRALADHGIDYFFANPGTDFPPIVEAIDRAKKTNAKIPKPMVIPHENLAVAMAHGAYLMNGKPQCVMVHVNVGTANAINNIVNASRDRIPIFLASGRTPITEKGVFGSRDRPIHWAQEMFDQGALLRETVKWDYELRMPAQASDTVSRAVEVMMARPRGPVYLVLPREPLAGALPEPIGPVKPRAQAPASHPDPQSIAQLADWIANAERPLIIASAMGSDGNAPLAQLAERCAIPVVMHSSRKVCIASSHPMHFGYEPGTLLTEADLVITIDADAPWIPSLTSPPETARIVNIGEDPFFVRYPMRSFPADMAIQAGSANTLAALNAAMDSRLQKAEARIAPRRAKLAERNTARRAKLDQDCKPGAAISPAYLSRCIGEAVGPDAVIFNEYTLRADYCPREKPDTLFALGPAGGLGWGFGAALGAKLVSPEKLVVAVLGDGAYMFNNPMVAHWVSHAHDLPILTILFNNTRYGAVRGATLSMFKDDAAGENNCRTLADLDPAPPFEDMARAQGAHAERVEKPEDVPAALARARDVVLKEKRQAFLNVITPY